MWKRPDEAPSPGSAQQSPGSPPPAPGSPTSPPPASAPPRSGSGVAARLGPTLTWEGKLAGEEDLLVARVGAQVSTLVENQPDEVALLLRTWLGDRRTVKR